MVGKKMYQVLLKEKNHLFDKTIVTMTKPNLKISALH